MADQFSFNHIRALLNEEIKKYKALQKPVPKLRVSREKYMHQLQENQLVKEELDLCDDDAEIFKRVGPVLVKQDNDSAKETVETRIKYINDEIASIEKQLEESTKNLEKSRTKIMQWQDLMQKAVAQAQSRGEQIPKELMAAAGAAQTAQ